MAKKFLSNLASTLKGSALTRTMKRLAAARTPVRLEVEGTDCTFYTVFALRGETVVFSKPKDLPEKILDMGGWVRFIVPEATKEVVRMRISNPNFRRARGDYVFLCDMPEEFSGKTKRGADRFNTTRFNNLNLVLPHLEEQFRIVDISRTGCKVFVGTQDLTEVLVVGEELKHTKVSVGKTALQIELNSLFLRVNRSPTAGFEWRLNEKGPSNKVFGHLMESLHKAEIGKMKIKTTANDVGRKAQARA